MSRTNSSRIAIAIAATLASGGARAASLPFIHQGTVFRDAKGAPLKAPEGVACAGGGRFVVGDTGNGRLLTYALKDGKLAGGEEIKLAELPFPVRVQVDSKGNVFALDGKSNRVVKVDANGGFGGVVEPQGAGVASTLRIGAFKVDGADGFVLLDLTAGRVLVTDASGSVARAVELPRGRSVFTDVAVDGSGTLYALDAVGATLWSAEKSATAFHPLAKDLREHMSFGTYVTLWKNRILLVDQNGSGIVTLGPDGGFQGRQLGIGWNDGLVNYPAQLCVTPEGTAILADRFNNRVQLFAITE